MSDPHNTVCVTTSRVQSFHMLSSNNDKINNTSISKSPASTILKSTTTPTLTISTLDHFSQISDAVISKSSKPPVTLAVKEPKPEQSPDHNPGRSGASSVGKLMDMLGSKDWEMCLGKALEC